MKKTIYRAVLIAMVALFAIYSPLAASEMDDRIESTAKESYVFKTYLSDDDIDIESKDGVVTLTGTVAEETRKSLAQETVAGIAGVTSVNNELELTDEAPAQYSDAWLITKVKTSLLFHRSVSGIKTEVSSEDGIVTLRGEATSQAQKDLAAEYAKDIEGVKDVKNEMTVVTAASKQDEKVTAEKRDAQAKQDKKVMAEKRDAQAKQDEKVIAEKRDDQAKQDEKLMSEKTDDRMKSGEKTMGQKMGDVVDDTTGYIDDASITAMVKSALMYNRSTSALNTTVKTNEGVVSLGGEAANAAEIALATKLVSDVNGVKRVVNNMTIDKTVSTIN